MKDLTFNNRVFRQAKTLQDAGHAVTVVSLGLPIADLRALASGVEFRELSCLRPAPFPVTPGEFFHYLKCYLAFRLGLTPPRKPVDTGPLRESRPVRILRRHSADAAVAWQAGVLSFLLFLVGSAAIWCVYSALRLGRLAGASVVRLLSVAGFSRLTPESDPGLAHERPSALLVLRPVAAFALQILFRDAILRELKGKPFDLVHSHDSHALLAASALARQNHAPLLYDAVEVPINRVRWSARFVPSWIISLKDRRDRALIESCQACCTIGRGVAGLLANHYDISVPEVIRNCRFYEDVEKNDLIRKDLGLKAGERLIVSINSVNIGLGVEETIEALALLPENCHLATLGPMPSDSFLAELKNKAAALGVEGRVHFLAPRPTNEFLVYAAGADIGVVAIQKHTLNFTLSLPNRVFELVMARLPIAASALPDISDLMQEFQLGLVFDETDPQEMARVIGEMLSEERLTVYRAAVDRAARQLCWEHEGLIYLRLVERAARQMPGG